MEQDIYCNQIHLDREHLRQVLDPVYIASLAADIQARGLLQAIAVRPREGGGWRLVAGRCRLEACRSLDYLTIPCRILEEGDLDEIDGLQENLVRRQMNPLEEALAVQMLHDKKKLSIAQICERLNRGTSWVQDRLAMLTLPDNFKAAIADKKISIGAAFQLTLIEDGPLRDYYLSVAIVNGATVHQCEAWYLDWKARQMLTNPTGQQTRIPQLPGRPSDPLLRCNLCDLDAPHSETVLLRVCAGCHELVRQGLSLAIQHPPVPDAKPAAS